MHESCELVRVSELRKRRQYRQGHGGKEGGREEGAGRGESAVEREGEGGSRRVNAGHEWVCPS